MGFLFRWLGRGALIAASLGCTPRVPEGAQAKAPVVEPAPRETSTPTAQPQISGEDSIRELDAFVAAHPDVLTAEAAPYGPALMWALEFEREEAALALVAAGAAPSVRVTNDGFTPLHLAVIARRIDAVRALIEGKADLEARDDDGRTPLHWGPFAYAPQRIQMYGDAELGISPGTRIADAGPAVVIGVLLDAGAKIDAVDGRGNTPLHEAAAIGSWRGAEALLARGAEANVKNAAGETPLTIAERRGDGDIVKMMKKKWDKRK